MCVRIGHDLTPFGNLLGRDVFELNRNIILDMKFHFLECRFEKYSINCSLLFLILNFLILCTAIFNDCYSVISSFQIFSSPQTTISIDSFKF